MEGFVEKAKRELKPMVPKEYFEVIVNEKKIACID